MVDNKIISKTDLLKNRTDPTGGSFPPYYETKKGWAYLGNSLNILKHFRSKSVHLVLTSPPFALIKKKSYGNVSAEDYIEWFRPFGEEIWRILKDNGSFVLDIGGVWNKGEPTKSLYNYRLLLDLCDGTKPLFKLAQEFYWFNPAKMPTPAQWVTIERVRVKDAVHTIWWLSKTARPDANNRRVLANYSKSMMNLLDRGYNAGLRPSGHHVSGEWRKDNGGSIPPNIIISANTKSTDDYLQACKKLGLRPNPSRFVDSVPIFFIQFLTSHPRNLVLDPFAGSNVVGFQAESLNRRWVAIERNEEYLIASSFRFSPDNVQLSPEADLTRYIVKSK